MLWLSLTPISLMTEGLPYDWRHTFLKPDFFDIVVGIWQPQHDASSFVFANSSKYKHNNAFGNFCILFC